MKTPILRRLCYLLAVSLAVSCAEDDIANSVPDEVEMVAGLEAPFIDSESSIDVKDTRTVIVEGSGYDEGFGTKWLPKEKIGVYSSYSKNVEFTGTNTKNSESVTFRGLLIGSAKYAYYPYSEENNGVSYDKVKGSIPVVREYHTSNAELPYDYRIGSVRSSNLLSTSFNFNRLVSILQIGVNATGTPLEGGRIVSVSMKVNNNRNISGNFTMNLQRRTLTLAAQNEDCDSMLLYWSNNPTLSNGITRYAYTTVLPAIKKGDKLTFVIETATSKATVETTSTVDHIAGGLYNIPLNLASFEDAEFDNIQGDGDDTEEQPEEKPTSDIKILSMKFEVEKNPGKILGRRLKFNTSTGKPGYETVTEEVCTIDQENQKITLYLPYLNNRKLVPTITTTEGAMIAYEDGLIESGVTEVDFFKYKQIAVGNELGEMTMYDVELTNTGLPVIVINQESGTTSTETNSDYTNASNAWFAATGAKWQPKDSDWEQESGVDWFAAYYPDGSIGLRDKYGSLVNSDVIDASTRVRGNVTQQMPKKAFAVKLKEKSRVLGMPAHKRWVLLANWKDRTIMRNEVAFGIADVFKKQFPNDGLAWNPSGQHVELVYNGVHVGNYYLCEQIKIDGNRLDINDPYEDSGAAPAECGYLLECDDAYDEEENPKFITKHYVPFMFKDAGTNEMLDYAKGLVFGIEDNLYAGYKGNQTSFETAFNTLDITSVVDYWLIQELMMNCEMQHPKSVYMYINDGKLYAGPIWDFDWLTLPVDGNPVTDYDYKKSILEHAKASSSWFGSKTYYSFRAKSEPTAVKEDRSYMWYPMLVKSNTFKNVAAERWSAVSGALKSYAGTLSVLAEKLKQSEAENWRMWQLDNKSNRTRASLYNLGHTMDKNSGGYCGDEAMTFENAVSTLSQMLIKRIDGMSYVTSKTWPSVDIKEE